MRKRDVEKGGLRGIYRRGKGERQLEAQGNNWRLGHSELVHAQLRCGEQRGKPHGSCWTMCGEERGAQRPRLLESTNPRAEQRAKWRWVLSRLMGERWLVSSFARSMVHRMGFEAGQAMAKRVNY